MKKYIILLFFISFCNMYSQTNSLKFNLVTKDSLFKKNISFNTHTKLKFHSNYSIYNSGTNFNSNYYISKDSIEFKGFKLIPKNNFSGVKQDFYNPHGASSIGAAIFMGVFDWFTK